MALAALLPVRGAAVVPFGLFTKAAIGTLFFLYGARLAREAVRIWGANCRSRPIGSLPP